MILVVIVDSVVRQLTSFTRSRGRALGGQSIEILQGNEAYEGKLRVWFPRVPG